MQLEMIGSGRISSGGNLVVRLNKAGPECVVYNQLMSAMRDEFGSQVEKPAATSLEGLR
jgi:6-phosphogluconate dehydrogenase (decarboxylating)